MPDGQLPFPTGLPAAKLACLLMLSQILDTVVILQMYHAPAIVTAAHAAGVLMCLD